MRKPVFNNDHDNSQKPHSPELAVQSNLPAEESSSIPGTIGENYPEIFQKADGFCDGTDTNQYLEPDTDLSVEQHNSTPINPRSTKYDLRHNQKPNFHDE